MQRRAAELLRGQVCMAVVCEELESEAPPFVVPRHLSPSCPSPRPSYKASIEGIESTALAASLGSCKWEPQHLPIQNIIPASFGWMELKITQAMV